MTSSDDERPRGGTTQREIIDTGDEPVDVVLHIGCSEQWATWAINTYKQSTSNDVTQTDILLKESDGFGVVSSTRDTIRDQLDGGDPTQVIDHAPYSYRVGFSESRARELLADLEDAIEFGADAHKLELRLTHETLYSLVKQFQEQIQ